MNVEIDFVPDDGLPQVLHADMSRELFDQINRVIAGPHPEMVTIKIPSRVERNGPTHDWIFRASRITLREVP